MKVSILGLGYVGTVAAACLAYEGHDVIGVDVSMVKVELINHGKTPIVEEEIEELIKEAVSRGKLRATCDLREAIRNSEISMICVGTPSQTNGNLDLAQIHRICQELGQALREKSGSHVIVVRSTVLPGTTRNFIIPTIETSSGKKLGGGWRICVNPEFMREGNSVHDFYHPARTIIGEIAPGDGDLLAELYKSIDAPLIRTNLETAEMIKYVDNCWHALKIGFANEIGRICKALGVDGYKVMEIFLLDTKLNLSPYYLKPGFAFGGSCLPKDVRAVIYQAHNLGLELPILNAILPSNRNHLDKAVELIASKGRRKIGMLGLSFKAGTDDLRESPLVELAEQLLGKGYDIRIYDPYVQIANLLGANRDYILGRLPHLARIMVENLDELLTYAEVVVVGHYSKEWAAIIDSKLREDQILIDLVHIVDSDKRGRGGYEGICW